jgi:hypothetical protein
MVSHVIWSKDGLFSQIGGWSSVHFQSLYNMLLLLLIIMIIFIMNIINIVIIYYYYSIIFLFLLNMHHTMDILWNGRRKTTHHFLTMARLL